MFDFSFNEKLTSTIPKNNRGGLSTIDGGILDRSVEFRTQECGVGWNPDFAVDFLSAPFNSYVFSLLSPLVLAQVCPVKTWTLSLVVVVMGLGDDEWLSNDESVSLLYKEQKQFLNWNPHFTLARG